MPNRFALPYYEWYWHQSMIVLQDSAERLHRLHLFAKEAVHGNCILCTIKHTLAHFGNTNSLTFAQMCWLNHFLNDKSTCVASQHSCYAHRFILLSCCLLRLCYIDFIRKLWIIFHIMQWYSTEIGKKNKLYWLYLLTCVYCNVRKCLHHEYTSKLKIIPATLRWIMHV